MPLTAWACSRPARNLGSDFRRRRACSAHFADRVGVNSGWWSSRPMVSLYFLDRPRMSSQVLGVYSPEPKPAEVTLHSIQFRVIDQLSQWGEDGSPILQPAKRSRRSLDSPQLTIGLPASVEAKLGRSTWPLGTIHHKHGSGTVVEDMDRPRLEQACHLRRRCPILLTAAFQQVVDGQLRGLRTHLDRPTPDWDPARDRDLSSHTAGQKPVQRWEPLHIEIIYHSLAAMADGHAATSLWRGPPAPSPAPRSFRFRPSNQARSA